MKNRFYFLFGILIFLTACKQESKNSSEKKPALENERLVASTVNILKIENEKLAPKIGAKKEEKKYPFPLRQTKNFDNPARHVLVHDSLSSGIVFCPEVPERVVVQKGSSFGTQQQDEPFMIVDEPAEFPGGKIKFFEYLLKNMKLTSEMEVGGKCYLRFVVGLDGAISNVVILKGVVDCPDCDKEAKRLIENMPNWIPAKIDGKQVKSYFQLPIKFE
jgi:protein TonB